VVSAIIVAAGKGIRMNSDIRKQYLHLGGEPILVRTVKTFSGCPSIREIWLVVPAEDMDDCLQMVHSHPEIAIPAHVVTGGKSRQESVYHGLVAMEDHVDPEDLVAIHDGVRPLISRHHIESCISSAGKTGASILAIPVSETVKQVESDTGRISRTLERESLWLAQTPQVFNYRILRDAHEKAISEGIEATDDAMMMEMLNIPVQIVAGDRKNIKITTPEDLALGEAILSMQQDCTRSP
jgi:2-C-methyl-D-erythritol 4-phosphate cytidylyltransferase